MNAPIHWLLEGEAFVQYRARVDLLAQSESDDTVRAARAAMLADPRVVAMVDELRGWPGKVIASHKSAGQPFHKLTFIADLGLMIGDPGVESIVSAILSRQSGAGPFQLPMRIAQHYGGSGAEEWAWALCDAPLIVYGLAALGLADDPRVRTAVSYLTGLVRENGWPCTVSKELGTFRGPGKKGDPCPFATLAMLKALSCFPDLRDSELARIGVETLLDLWRDSRSRHPYMFFMGTDFRKLKAPLVWYDLLHVLDVLSGFPSLAQDERFRDMLATLEGKADRQSRFTAESVWMPWKAWEFGQKKEPSRWVTLLAWRVLSRMDEGDVSLPLPR
jgi:hypothetical protein